MTVCPKIFWSSHKIIFISKQESAREGELSEDRFMTPSKQSRFRCVICLKRWLEMPALSSVKKESVGLGGSGIGTEENKIAKAGRPCSWESYETNWNILLFRNKFFLKFWLTLKPAE
jgi:hypothetical protein